MFYLILFLAVIFFCLWVFKVIIFMTFKDVLLLAVLVVFPLYLWRQLRKL